jgi:hypothetical protein
MVPAGTNVSFTFYSNVGYQLSKLYVNDFETASTNPYNFEPTGNTTLYITSMEISTAPAGPNGPIGPIIFPTNPNVSIPSDVTYTVGVTPFWGWIVVIAVILVLFSIAVVRARSQGK